MQKIGENCDAVMPKQTPAIANLQIIDQKIPFIKIMCANMIASIFMFSLLVMMWRDSSGKRSVIRRHLKVFFVDMIRSVCTLSEYMHVVMLTQ